MARDKKGFNISRTTKIRYESPSRSWSIKVPKTKPGRLDYCEQKISPSPDNGVLANLARKIPNADVFSFYKSAYNRWIKALNKYPDYAGTSTIDNIPYREYYFKSCQSITGAWKVSYRDDGTRDFGIDTENTQPDITFNGGGYDTGGINTGGNGGYDSNYYFCESFPVIILEDGTEIDAGLEQDTNITCYEQQIVCTNGGCTPGQVYIPYDGVSSDSVAAQGRITYPASPDSETNGYVYQISGNNLSFTLEEDITNPVPECAGNCILSTDYGTGQGTAVIKWGDGKSFSTTDLPLTFTIEPITSSVSYQHTWQLPEGCTELTEFNTSDPVSSYTLNKLTGEIVDSGTAIEATPYCSLPELGQLSWSLGSHTTNNPPISYELAIKALLIDGFFTAFPKEIIDWNLTESPGSGIVVDWGGGDIDIIDGTTWSSASGTYGGWFWIVWRDIDCAGQEQTVWGIARTTTMTPSGTFTYHTLELPFTANNTFEIDPATLWEFRTISNVGLTTCSPGTTLRRLEYGLKKNGVNTSGTLGFNNTLFPLTEQKTYLVYRDPVFRIRITSNTGDYSERATSIPPDVSLAVGGCQLVVNYTDTTSSDPIEYPVCPIVSAVPNTVKVSDSTGLVATYEYDSAPTDFIYECSLGGGSGWKLNFQPQNVSVNFDANCKPTNIVINQKTETDCCFTRSVSGGKTKWIDVSGIHNPPTIDCSALGAFSACSLPNFTQVGFVDLGGGVYQSLVKSDDEVITDTCTAKSKLSIFANGSLVKEDIICGDASSLLDTLSITSADQIDYTLTIFVNEIQVDQITYEDYNPTSNAELFYIEQFPYCDVLSTDDEGNSTQYYLSDDVRYVCRTRIGGEIDIDNGPYTVQIIDNGDGTYTVLILDANGNIISSETYGTQPSVNGSNPNSPVQINTTNQDPYLTCTCPDHDRKIYYYDQSKQDEGYISDWSAANGAGAPNILGTRCCKHVFSVLNQLGVADKYIPEDFPTDPVPEKYLVPGMIGDDAIKALKPNDINRL